MVTGQVGEDGCVLTLRGRSRQTGASCALPKRPLAASCSTRARGEFAPQAHSSPPWARACSSWWWRAAAGAELADGNVWVAYIVGGAFVTAGAAAAMMAADYRLEFDGAARPCS